MAITEDTLRLVDRMRTELAAITGAQANDLTRAWATAWQEVSLDLQVALLELAAAAEDGKITRTMVMRSERLTRSLLVINNRLEALAGEAGVRITGDLEALIRLGDDLQAGIVATQLPPGTRDVIDTWSRVDGRQLQAIVRRSTEQITSTLQPLSAEATSAVRRELVRGIAAGSNPRVTARRMLARTEGAFNGGLTRALVVARTESLDAHRAAALESMQANTDTLSGWVWTSALTNRTCPSCFAQHGTLHPVTEPGPLDHQQGRCVAVPKTKTWAELGFTGIDEPEDLIPDAGQVFNNLAVEDQRAILGPRGYEAWQAGNFPMDAWSTRHSTDGWRDSYRASKPPSGGRDTLSAAS